MSVSEFLFPREEIQLSFNADDLIEYAKTRYQVYFTDQRLVLYARTGLLLKRDNVVTIAFQDVLKLDYKERGLRKKGYCVVVTPLMKYEFRGKPEVVRELIKHLQKFIPTRAIDSVKERETIIKEKETVMVSCPYCNQLMPVASTVCPHCGAKRTV